MIRHFIHYVLLVTFSVFVLTTNAHASVMDVSDTVMAHVESTIEFPPHQTMMHCDETTAHVDTQSCCDCDCNCMLNHCHKVQNILPSVSTDLSSSLIQYVTDSTVTLQYSSITPRKRPPKV
jgi:recombination DNA repair RAD52 pathway protein